MKESLELLLQLFVFLDTMENNNTPKLLDYLAACISQLLPEEKMRNVLLQHKCHDVYASYFMFLINQTKFISIETISHLIHQYVILEPLACSESLLFRDVVREMFKLTKHCSELCDYSKVELIALTLRLAQLHRDGAWTRISASPC